MRPYITDTNILCCPICGNKHPQRLAWLDVNTGEFVQWEINDIEQETDWCPSCKKLIKAVETIE